jgi:hypothetical protein
MQDGILSRCDLVVNKFPRGAMSMRILRRWKQIAGRPYWLLLALAILLMARLPAFGADAAPFLGQWVSMTFEGAGPLAGDVGCQVVGWTDREIKLEPISGNPTRVRGEWVRTYQSLWVAVTSERCRFPGETKFEPVHMAVIGWSVTGIVDPSSGKMRANATYHQCNGTLCGLMQASQRDFQTELTIVNGELVDADPTQKPEDHRAFIPKNTEASRTEGALRELKPLLGFVDADDVGRLYDESASVVKAAITKDQLRSTFADLRAKTGRAVSRSVMQTAYAIYGPNNDMRRNEFEIVVNTIYFTQNRSSLEFSVLQRESGKWKMAWYYIGGKMGPPQ